MWLGQLASGCAYGPVRAVTALQVVPFSRCATVSELAGRFNGGNKAAQGTLTILKVDCSCGT
jgi:hypothetical protein